MKINTKGITLIALVITIIVLLILAGVSIAMLTGQNGILTQAQNSKTETEKASLIERVQLDILEEQSKGNESGIDAGTLQTILNNYFTNVPPDANDITTDIVLIANEDYGGYDIPLSDIYNGKIKIKGITGAELTEDQKKELYGAYVTNYDCNNNDVIETDALGKWMIFHIDDDNIYLIASDYITEVPAGKSGTNIPSIGSDSSNPRGMCFTNILNDYAGSADVSDIGKELNNDYFYVKKYTSTANNIKAVAYMLDTNIWSEFKGDNADYAIGGPTIELFFESYNKAHPDGNYPNGRYKARAKAGGTYGYEISADGGINWSDSMSPSSDEDNLDKSDSTYVIANSFDKAYGMWIASPSNSRRGQCFICI